MRCTAVDRRVIIVCSDDHRETLLRQRTRAGRRVQVYLQDHAAAEGVHGYVRNLPDGRVEAVIEGDEESVLRVERALRRGPAGARIDDVVVEAAAPSGRATGFAVR